MSEWDDIQKLTFPGLLSVLLIISDGSSLDVAHAAGLYQSAPSLFNAKRHLTQTVEQAGDTVAQAVPADDGQQIDGDVPFSELNEALSAARSRLNELTKAAEIAKVAGELREKLQTAETENQQLKSVLSQLQTNLSNLQSAKQAADAQILTLEKSAADAAAESKRLDEELVSMRWQNSQLSSSLEQTETAARESADELTRVRSEFSAREESLNAAADESAGEITRLQRELDETKGRLLVAESEQAENAAELNELREITQDTAEESSRLAQDLDATITELADTRSQLTTAEAALQDAEIKFQSAQQETGVLRSQLASNRSQNEQLRGELETSETELIQSRTLNAGLEQQVELLKAAAGEATDAARQNLLAVEDQIDEINAALASVKADDWLGEASGTADDDTPVASNAAAARAAAVAAGEGWVPRPSPPRAGVGETALLAVAAPDTDTTAVETVGSSLGGTSLNVESRFDQTGPAVGINLASLTTDLPVNERQDAEALLNELQATKGQRGLSMTVPGELLFAVDGEEIEPAGFDPLSNVAKLVNLYDDRDVLIIGHTDAVGDANYNQLLSERRAALVKSFFVDNFQISADRVQIEGKGELDPIQSNATADGRNANRRVEVVILD